jgi:predicted dehydrogenase
MLVDNIAIIGLGSIGKRHLRLLRALKPNIRITVVRSGKGNVVPEEEMADRVLYSIQDAIKSGIQAAVVATPAVCHIDQSIKLMSANIHLLLEKPLSHNMNRVEKLLKIKKKTKVVGVVGYCLRHDPSAKKFKELLSKEQTGQILHVQVDCGSYLPDWRPDQDYRQATSSKKETGGGALLELSHELDYINWFFGKMQNVQASINYSGTLDIDVEDSADMIFTSKEGFPISVHIDFNSHRSHRKCTVHCTEGDLAWDAVSKTVSWKPANGLEQVQNFNKDKDEMYREQLAHFFKCIELSQMPAVSLENGATALQMVLATQESHISGKRVALV